MAIPLPTLDVLETLTIATPCTVPWDEMSGDDRTRFCGRCRRHVFDLSAMTTAEASDLLGAPGGRPCVRLYRRPDGRVMTADCPVGVRARIWRRAVWAASLFALLFLPACRVIQGVPAPDDIGAAATKPPSADANSVPQSKPVNP